MKAVTLAIFLMAISTASAQYADSLALYDGGFTTKFDARQFSPIKGANDPMGTGFYRFNRQKWAGLAIATAAGFIDGVCEGYEFDGRHSFERKWGSDPSGFWGSQSWRMIYNDGDPAKGEKSSLASAVGALDAYHAMDDLRKAGYISGSIFIGVGGHRANTRWWHYAIDYAITFAVSGYAKSRGMNWVRY